MDCLGSLRKAGLCSFSTTNFDSKEDTSSFLSFGHILSLSQFERLGL